MARQQLQVIEVECRLRRSRVVKRVQTLSLMRSNRFWIRRSKVLYLIFRWCGAISSQVGWLFSLRSDLGTQIEPHGMLGDPAKVRDVTARQ